jgi:hypothetical protein
MLYAGADVLKFYFHIRDGEELVRDEEGLALSDWSAIRNEGHQSALDIASERGCYSGHCSIEVVDQFGAIVDRIVIQPVQKYIC